MLEWVYPPLRLNQYKHMAKYDLSDTEVIC